MMANIGRHVYVPGHQMAVDKSVRSKVNLFFFASEWSVSPTLYERAAIELTILHRGTVSRVGNTSVDMLQTFVDERNSNFLASRLCRLVNINPRTKKSVVLPESIRQALADNIRATDRRKLSDTAKLLTAIPADRFASKILVRYSDMDHLFHANQGSYLGFALECASLASTSGYYRHFKEDMCFYRIRAIWAVHLQEAFAGDELDVLTWQDSDYPMLLYFAIQKKEQFIYRASIEYYDAISC